MFRLSLAAIVAAFVLASAVSDAKSCPPVAVSSYGLQVQSAGCFAPAAVAVQSYGVSAYAVPVQAVQVQAFAVPVAAAVNVKVNAHRPRVFGRVFGPRVSVRVR